MVLSHFDSVNVERMRLVGYPDWRTQRNRVIGLLPWHERAMKKQVYSLSRQMVREHLRAPHTASSAVYGVYIDIDR